MYHEFFQVFPWLISATLEFPFLVFSWNRDFVLLWGFFNLNFVVKYCAFQVQISQLVGFFLFSQASICQIIVTTGADHAIFPKQLAEKNGIVLQAPLCYLARKFSVVIKNMINYTILSSKFLQLD